MRRFSIHGQQAWKVLGGTVRSQAAEMRIPPGASEGGPDNRHRRSDQWLFVLSGQGTARVEEKEIPLKAGILLLIEKGERHTIRASGRRPLKTLDIYTPPAY